MAPNSGAPLSRAPLLPRLDKYELIEEIGHGGMATVYRARDPRLGREVAVKVIHRHLRENTEVGTRFVAEAKASAKLRHPGIVDVYDVSDEDDPERYLVVELIRGQTLRKVLCAHRDMPAEVGASIVKELCDAVEHAHASSVIHRDIKPENVLVELPSDRANAEAGATPAAVPAAPSVDSERETGVRAIARGGESETPLSTPTASPDSWDTQASPRDLVVPSSKPSKSSKQPGSRSPKSEHADPKGGPSRATARARADRGVVIKITDFGIAKILDAQGVTSTGQVLGSPAHMAPEQIEGGDVDARTDVFALGVLLYEALVGHLPFEGKNPAQVLRRVLDGTYAPADLERPSVGGRWARVIADALAKEPSERIASAADLAQRIDEELAALGIDDTKEEISAYFADPAGFTAEHGKLLVARLAARGEAARVAGDVGGAAADWNRALALAPDDLTILKRMASLTRGANRRVMLRRGLIVAVASAGLGLSAFGVARAVRATRGAEDPGSSTLGVGTPRDRASTSEADAAVDAGPVKNGASGDPTGRAATDLTARGRMPLPPVTTLATAATAVVAGPRAVQFSFKPGGVTLVLDGATEKWVGREFRLAPGPHTVVVTPNDPTCCQRYAGAVTIEPALAGQPDAVQGVHVDLKLNPASVSLAAGAPRGATLECPDVNLIASPGSPKQLTLKDPFWSGRCTLRAADGTSRKTSVRIAAGTQTVVPWD